MTEPRRILLVHLGENWIRGSEQVLLDLARSLDRTRFTPIVWCNAPSLAEACRAAGIVAHQSPFGFFLGNRTSPLRLRRYLSYIRTGLRILRQERIDLIHCNGAAPLQFCMPAARLARRPVLGHLHSDEDRRSRFAFLTHLADMAIGVSRQTVAGLAEDGMDARLLRVVHNGIDVARFDAGTDPPGGLRQALGIPGEALVIGTVASLIHRKGHDVLLEAMAMLRAASPEAHLLIAGEGSERPLYEAMIERLGLAGRVHLLGYLGNPAPVYRAADVFVLASRSEALPLVLLEAARFGLPCVATSVGGTAEAVLDGATGFLVPADDPHRLAEALRRLVGDPALREALGQRARDHAARSFGLSGMVSAFETIYDELLDRSRAPRPSWAGRLAPYARLLRGRAGAGAAAEQHREAAARSPTRVPTDGVDHAG